MGRSPRNSPYGLDNELLAQGPQLKFLNNQRGYVRQTLTPDRWRVDFQAPGRANVRERHVDRP
jgi:hypothetical protein